MSAEQYYDICVNAVGELVTIETADGASYYAVIAGIDHNYLYLQSIDLFSILLMNDYLKTDNNELKDTFLTIPLASIITLTFVPLVHF